MLILIERDHVNQNGFTLIELMIAMVVSLLLMAGLYSNFIMQSRVQNAQSEVVETTEDLRIAAQIIQSELRMAQLISATGTGQIDYTPLDTPPTIVCGTGTFETIGHFQYRHATGTSGTANNSVYWKSPGTCLYQEMVRNLREPGTPLPPASNTGFYVVAGNPFAVSMTSSYQDHLHQLKYWTLSFEASPRNQ